MKEEEIVAETAEEKSIKTTQNIETKKAQTLSQMTAAEEDK